MKKSTENKNKKGFLSGLTKKSKIFIIAGIAILLAAMVLLVLFAIPHENNSDDTTKQETKKETVKVQTETAAQTLAAPTDPHSTDVTLVSKGWTYGNTYTNPLTGLAATSDCSTKRPVAIMINNIEAACPQVGISDADIIYECLAEGGITRLLMVSMEYENLDVVGSVRSSREYYIDFAKNHDAIYIHAGGSEEAYSQISEREIDHLDGVNTDRRTGINVSGTVFYRDQQRMQTMSYEHTLMTTGEKIAAGVELMGYRTSVSGGFTDSIKIIEDGWELRLNGRSATEIKIPYYSYQNPEYSYNSETNTYYRSQFYGSPHIDGATGEQLNFTNVLLLNVPHTNRGDSYGHLDVYTVGSGTGYYVYGGSAIEIKWSKDSQDSAMRLTESDGSPLILNAGKTIINIISNEVFSSMTIN